MDATDTKKLQEALSIIVDLDAQVSNFTGRSTRAGQGWAAWAQHDDRTAAQKTTMKRALTSLSTLIKGAKTLRSDVTKIGKSAGDSKVLAKYATAKAYRDKVLVKELAPLKKWAETGASLTADLNSVMSSKNFKHPNANLPDEVSTYNAVEKYVEHYKRLTAALAKL